MTRKSEIPEGQFGPVYNVTGQGLAGYRKALNPSREERQEYGAAVEAAVIAMQRRELIREACEPEQRPNCTSGTWDEYPAEAIRRQQQTALLSCPARERAARTPHEWEVAYVNAMPRGFIPSWEHPVDEAPAEQVAA